MWKPKTLLIILTVIAALTTLALTFTKTAEPSYQGHSLSYWLATPPEDSTTAVMAIGTKAIPWLIRWTKYEPPAWRKKFALLALQHDQKEIFKLLNSPEHNKAIVAFQILGTNALPALLPLVDIMKDTNHPDSARVSTYALPSLGEQTLPHLVDALSDANPSRRKAILFSIAIMAKRGASTNACLGPLLKATTDPSPVVRRAATNAILWLAPQALTNSTSQ
jgi:hypothetical protein